jgi:hypothetical protein
MATLKPVFLPKAEDKNERLNELIKALSVFMADIDRVVREIAEDIENLTP